MMATDTEDCAECKTTLDDLENIDTETDKHGIVFIKTADGTVAREYGCRSVPALIYFEKSAPSVYEGDISAEEDVLQWLIQQKTEDTIESVNKELLEQLVESSHYLVAFFCKLNVCLITANLSFSLVQTNRTAVPVILF